MIIAKQTNYTEIRIISSWMENFEIKEKYLLNEIKWDASNVNVCDYLTGELPINKFTH